MFGWGRLGVLGSGSNCTSLHYTALHLTALHCTAPHCTAPHCTAPQCTTPHCTAPRCTAPQCTAPQCTAQHCPTLHRGVQEAGMGEAASASSVRIGIRIQDQDYSTIHQKPSWLLPLPSWTSIHSSQTPGWQPLSSQIPSHLQHSPGRARIQQSPGWARICWLTATSSSFSEGDPRCHQQSRQEAWDSSIAPP